MSSKIITISREFGSGGRTIGKETAQKLGIPCYDSEIIERIALETGFDAEYIKEQGEPAACFYSRGYGVPCKAYRGGIRGARGDARKASEG
ncbi:hypothetical protein BRYFOR_09609 [Marvinbryantia formatexigens DSM 14469]|uniref:Cytidylate kinase n=1 Tax=Marvinbryantia formatexigens DSM 14469 TaxID=478749 RepID=C6LLR1_9FIRM|nr:cytidylate kinase family protein [Marvinbryantia formatexigens]EET58452.1 hypothetical protein BRYFOR_09609 [Marvinbryantia formatexigens DSM 14469]SDF17201.1 Cytidylate kinase-like family protein [Marvinbryantia formatexigens]